MWNVSSKASHLAWCFDEALAMTESVQMVLVVLRACNLVNSFGLTSYIRLEGVS